MFLCYYSDTQSYIIILIYNGSRDGPLGEGTFKTADALTADTISSHLLGWKAIDRSAIKGVGCKIM